jgi:multidrug efflux pump subunit AcrA (membrane-fusion protein)
LAILLVIVFIVGAVFIIFKLNFDAYDRSDELTASAAYETESLRVIPPKSTEYSTEAVRRTTLARQGTFAADLSFPNRAYVVVPRNGKFVSGKFGGDYVNEGDVIATFSVPDNSLEVTEAELNYEIARSAVNNSVDAYSRYLAQRNADAAKAALDALVDAGTPFDLLAPASGYITGLYLMPQGEFYVGQIYCFVNVTDVVQLRVAADASLPGSSDRVAMLKLGASVTIVPTRGDAPSFAGHVISTTSLIDGSVPIYAIITFDDPEAFADYIDGNANAIIDTQYEVRINLTDISDALLCPARAVRRENTYRYVTLVEDGVPKKRYVLTGLTSGSDVQILSGLSEGDQVIVP